MLAQQAQQARAGAGATTSGRRLTAAAAAPSPTAARCGCAVAAAALRPTTSPAPLVLQRRPALTQQQPHPRHPAPCRAFGGGGGGRGGPSSSGPAPTNLFSPVYLAIFGGYCALLLLHNPYIYAALTIAAVLPQNSAVTSLNNLVLLFYESGLFANFAEAVYCVRLVTWLSVGFMLGSFALFN